MQMAASSQIHPIIPISIQLPLLPQLFQHPLYPFRHQPAIPFRVATRRESRLPLARIRLYPRNAPRALHGSNQSAQLLDIGVGECSAKDDGPGRLAPVAGADVVGAGGGRFVLKEGDDFGGDVVFGAEVDAWRGRLAEEGAGGRCRRNVGRGALAFIFRLQPFNGAGTHRGTLAYGEDGDWFGGHEDACGSEHGMMRMAGCSGEFWSSFRIGVG